MRNLLNKHFPGRPLWRQLLMGVALLVIGMLFSAWAAVYLAYRHVVNHHIGYIIFAIVACGLLGAYRWLG